MADIFTSSSVYQGTFVIGTVTSDPHYQVCAVANIDASNNFVSTFWILKNGERVTNNIDHGAYKVRDKAGSLVSGMEQSSITPDLHGYFHTTAVSAAGIVDLNHYVLELYIAVDGATKHGSIGLVIGE